MSRWLVKAVIDFSRLFRAASKTTPLQMNPKDLEAFQKLCNTGNWEQLWVDKLTPWDKGLSSPALINLLKEGHIPEGTEEKPARALVPGCGGVRLSKKQRFSNIINSFGRATTALHWLHLSDSALALI